MSDQLRWESRGDRLHFTACKRFRVQMHGDGWLAVRERDRRHDVLPTLSDAKRWCEQIAKCAA